MKLKVALLQLIPENELSEQLEKGSSLFKVTVSLLKSLAIWLKNLIWQ